MKNYQQCFKEIFNEQKNPVIYYSPGRVNLIGEHIDYNGGLVFPAAISIGTYGAVLKREDQALRFYSENYPENGIVTVSLNDLSYQESHGWTNYAKGILQELISRGYKIDFGFDLYVDGNLPTASGLSSSASLEVLVSYIANDLYQLGLSRTDMALLSQVVENGYMGMHCGIMDQLIIANGVKDHALLMNTATLEMTPSHAAFDGYQIIIMNTNYKRKTTESKYNERVKECKEALDKIKPIYPVNYLCDLKVEQLDHIKTILSNELLYRRVKHTITEQQRTLDAMITMKERDALAFGKLLDQSHHSLKNDYEVTGFNLDTLVEAAKKHGAIGTRVTGAGFGGCAIALVKNECVDDFLINVKKDYIEKTNIIPDFYQVTFEDGVHQIHD